MDFGTQVVIAVVLPIVVIGVSGLAMALYVGIKDGWA